MNVTLTVLTIIFAALVLLWGIKYFKSKTLDEIRQDVYRLFLEAEHIFEDSHSGKQKMEWVIGKARSLLPAWAQIIITEEMFEKMLQFWFDQIKDLLDDGKPNQIKKAKGIKK